MASPELSGRSPLAGPAVAARESGRERLPLGLGPCRVVWEPGTRRAGGGWQAPGRCAAAATAPAGTRRSGRRAAGSEGASVPRAPEEPRTSPRICSTHRSVLSESLFALGGGWEASASLGSKLGVTRRACPGLRSCIVCTVAAASSRAPGGCDCLARPSCPWPDGGQASSGVSLSPRVPRGLPRPPTRPRRWLSVYALALRRSETPRAHLLFFLLSPCNRATPQESLLRVPGERYLGAKIWALSGLPGCGHFEPLPGDRARQRPCAPACAPS